MSEEKSAGRPTLYTADLAATICERLAEGRSLRSVCSDEDMPDRKSIYNWLRLYPEFEKQYEIAKADRADALVEDILDIADDGSNDWMQRNDEENVGWIVNGEHIQRSRVRIDARKWIASKILPKKYGDKIEHEHSGKVTLEQLVAGSFERDDSSSR